MIMKEGRTISSRSGCQVGFKFTFVLWKACLLTFISRVPRCSRWPARSRAASKFSLPTHTLLKQPTFSQLGDCADSLMRNSRGERTEREPRFLAHSEGTER